MSYILDALKKSEQERGHGEIPDVQTVHSSSLNYRNEKKVWWPYILITAVLLNLAAILYFIIDNEIKTETITIVAEKNHTLIDNSQAASDPAINTGTSSSVITNNSTIDHSLSHSMKQSTVDSTDNSAKQKDSGLPAPEKIASASPANNVKATPTTAKLAIKPVATDTLNIIDFYDLTEQMQREIPTIVISAHVYSSNPAQRSIVINNIFMEESEHILDGLILYEITQDGAIFNFQGTLFHYAVVSGWQ